ncbi:MAG: lasso RiPP family leader peptide-containing protein [Candidatus Schekmanbacteria bacterium]|nr:lasso RiPP family leader peptide-containing protein [Candidatus Schekmanbacteria bacterium]
MNVKQAPSEPPRRTKSTTAEAAPSAARLPYEPPLLTSAGKVSELTMSGTNSSTDGGGYS